MPSKNESQRHKLLRSAISKDGIAILHLLKQNPSKQYGSMMQLLGLTKKDSGGFAYYIRKLTKANLISKTVTGEYSITQTGKTFLRLFHSIDEKFMIDEQCKICHNSDDSNEHQFIKVCKNCYYVEDNEK